MKANLVEKKQIYVQCPSCHNENSHCISSLDPDTSFGPWYCDSCGVGIRGYIDGDGSVEITEAENRKEPTYVLLRLNPHDAPTYLIVRGADFIAQGEGTANEEQQGEEFFSSDEYYYNHECHPSIILQNAVAVIRDGKKEPNRVFEYITTRPAPHFVLGGDHEVNESVLSDCLRLADRTPPHNLAAVIES